jgi:beta-lactam-binding protein with PASTA domain
MWSVQALTSAGGTLRLLSEVMALLSSASDKASTPGGRGMTVILAKRALVETGLEMTHLLLP